VEGSDVEPEAGEPAPIGRSLALAAGVGAAIGLAVIGVVYGIVAIPVYALAQSDPHGLDRPFFRNALWRIAIPAGIGVGLVVGALVGVWYARGGHLPDDRSPYE
jgi:hypothetical protein